MRVYIYPVSLLTEVPDKVLLGFPPIAAQSKIWSLLYSISKALGDVGHIQYGFKTMN